MSYLHDRRLFRRLWRPGDPDTDLVTKRSEGRLKTYLSCTDQRAWCLEDAERRRHLIELMNARTRDAVDVGRVIPLQELVDLILAEKEEIIRRLRRRVEQLEKNCGGPLPPEEEEDDWRKRKRRTRSEADSAPRRSSATDGAGKGTSGRQSGAAPAGADDGGAAAAAPAGAEDGGAAGGDDEAAADDGGAAADETGEGAAAGGEQQAGLPAGAVPEEPTVAEAAGGASAAGKDRGVSFGGDGGEAVMAEEVVVVEGPSSSDTDGGPLTSEGEDNEDVSRGSKITSEVEETTSRGSKGASQGADGATSETASRGSRGASQGADAEETASRGSKGVSQGGETTEEEDGGGAGGASETASRGSRGTSKGGEAEHEEDGGAGGASETASRGSRGTSKGGEAEHEEDGGAGGASETASRGSRGTSKGGEAEEEEDGGAGGASETASRGSRGTSKGGEAEEEEDGGAGGASETASRGSRGTSKGGETEQEEDGGAGGTSETASRGSRGTSKGAEEGGAEGLSLGGEGEDVEEGGGGGTSETASRGSRGTSKGGEAEEEEDGGAGGISETASRGSRGASQGGEEGGAEGAEGDVDGGEAGGAGRVSEAGSRGSRGASEAGEGEDEGAGGGISETGSRGSRGVEGEDVEEGGAGGISETGSRGSGRASEGGQSRGSKGEGALPEDSEGEGTFEDAAEFLPEGGATGAESDTSEGPADDFHEPEGDLEFQGTCEEQVRHLKQLLAVKMAELQERDGYLVEALRQLENVSRIVRCQSDLKGRLDESELTIKTLQDEKARLLREKEAVLRGELPAVEGRPKLASVGTPCVEPGDSLEKILAVLDALAAELAEIPDESAVYDKATCMINACEALQAFGHEKEMQASKERARASHMYEQLEAQTNPEVMEEKQQAGVSFDKEKARFEADLAKMQETKEKMAALPHEAATDDADESDDTWRLRNNLHEMEQKLKRQTVEDLVPKKLSRYSDLPQDMEALLRKNEALKARVAELEKQLKGAGGEDRDEWYPAQEEAGAEDLGPATSEEKILANEVRVLKEENENLKRQLAQLRRPGDELDELKQRTVQSEASVLVMDERLRMMEANFASSQEELEMYRKRCAELEKLQAEVPHLTSVVDNFQTVVKERNLLHARVHELQCAVVDQEDEIRRLLVRIEHYADNAERCKMAEQMLEEQSQELAGQEEEIKSLLRKVEELANMASGHELTSKMAEETSSIITEQEREISSLMDQLDAEGQCREELNRVKKQLAAAQAEAESLRKRGQPGAGALEEVASLQKQVVALLESLPGEPAQTRVEDLRKHQNQPSLGAAESELRLALAEARSAICVAVDETRALRQQLRARRSSEVDVERRLSSEQEMRDRAEKVAISASRTLEMKEEELRLLGNQLEQASQENQQLKARLKDLEAQLQQATAPAQAPPAQAPSPPPVVVEDPALTERVDQLEKDKSELLQKVADLEAKLQEAERGAGGGQKTTTEDPHNVGSILRNLSAEIKNVRQLVPDQTDSSDLRDLVKQQLREIEELQMRISTSEMSDLRRENADLLAYVQKLDQEMETVNRTHQRELEDKDDEIRRLQRSLMECLQKVTVNADLQDKAERDVVRLKKALADAEIENYRLREQLKRREEDLDDCRRNLLDRNEKLRKLGQLDPGEAEDPSVTDRVLELEKEVAGLKESVADKDRQIADLRRNLKDCRSGGSDGGPADNATEELLRKCEKERAALLELVTNMMTQSGAGSVKQLRTVVGGGGGGGGSQRSGIFPGSPEIEQLKRDLFEINATGDAYVHLVTLEREEDLILRDLLEDRVTEAQADRKGEMERLRSDLDRAKYAFDMDTLDRYFEVMNAEEVRKVRARVERLVEEQARLLSGLELDERQAASLEDQLSQLRARNKDIGRVQEELLRAGQEANALLRDFVQSVSGKERSEREVAELRKGRGASVEQLRTIVGGENNVDVDLGETSKQLLGAVETELRELRRKEFGKVDAAVQVMPVSNTEDESLKSQLLPEDGMPEGSLSESFLGQLAAENAEKRCVCRMSELQEEKREEVAKELRALVASQMERLKAVKEAVTAEWREDLGLDQKVEALHRSCNDIASLQQLIALGDRDLMKMYLKLRKEARDAAVQAAGGENEGEQVGKLRELLREKEERIETLSEILTDASAQLQPDEVDAVGELSAVKMSLNRALRAQKERISTLKDKAKALWKAEHAQKLLDDIILLQKDIQRNSVAIEELQGKAMNDIERINANLQEADGGRLLASSEALQDKNKEIHDLRTEVTVKDRIIKALCSSESKYLAEEVSLARNVDWEELKHAGLEKSLRSVAENEEKLFELKMENEVLKELVKSKDCLICNLDVDLALREETAKNEDGWTVLEDVTSPMERCVQKLQEVYDALEGGHIKGNVKAIMEDVKVLPETLVRCLRNLREEAKGKSVLSSLLADKHRELTSLKLSLAVADRKAERESVAALWSLTTVKGLRKQLEDVVRQLRSEMEELEKTLEPTELGAARAQVEAMERRNAAILELQSSIEHKSKLMDVLQVKLLQFWQSDNLNEEVRRTLADKKRLEERASKLEAELKSLVNVVEVKNRYIAKLKDGRKEDGTEEMAEVRRYLARLVKQQVEDVKRLEGEPARKVLDKCEKVNEFLDLIHDASERIASWQKSLDAQQLKDKIGQLELKLAASEKERETLQSLVRDKDRKVKDLTGVLTQHWSAAAKVEGVVQGQLSLIRRLERKMAEAGDSGEDLKQELERVKRTHEEIAKVQREIKCRNEEMDSTLLGLLRNMKADALVETLGVENRKLKAECRHLEEWARDKDAEIAKLRKERLGAQVLSSKLKSKSLSEVTRVEAQLDEALRRYAEEMRDVVSYANRVRSSCGGDVPELTSVEDLLVENERLARFCGQLRDRAEEVGALQRLLEDKLRRCNIRCVKNSLLEQAESELKALREDKARLEADLELRARDVSEELLEDVRELGRLVDEYRRKEEQLSESVKLILEGMGADGDGKKELQAKLDAKLMERLSLASSISELQRTIASKTERTDEKRKKTREEQTEALYGELLARNVAVAKLEALVRQRDEEAAALRQNMRRLIKKDSAEDVGMKGDGGNLTKLHADVTRALFNVDVAVFSTHVVEAEDLRARLALAEKENETLKKMLRGDKEADGGLLDLVKEQKMEIGMLNGKLLAAEEKGRLLEDLVRQQLMEIQTLNARSPPNYDQLKEDYDQLKQASALLVDSIPESFVRATDEVERLRREVEELRSGEENRRLREELEALRRQLGPAAGEIRRLSEENQKLLQDMEAAEELGEEAGFSDLSPEDDAEDEDLEAEDAAEPVDEFVADIEDGLESLSSDEVSDGDAGQLDVSDAEEEAVLPEEGVSQAPGEDVTKTPPEVPSVTAKRRGRVCECSTKPRETSSELVSASRSRLCPCKPKPSRISRISAVEESVKEDDLEAEEPAPVAEEPAAEEVPVEEPVAEDVAVEEPAEDVPIEEPAEELPVEEPVAEDVAVEEPAEDVPVEEPAEELPVEEPVAEEVAVEEPAEDVPVEEPAEELPVEEPVAEEVPAEEPIAEELPVEEPVAEELPVEEPIAEEELPVEQPVVEEVPMTEASPDEAPDVTEASSDQVTESEDEEEQRQLDQRVVSVSSQLRAVRERMEDGGGLEELRQENECLRKMVENLSAQLQAAKKEIDVQVEISIIKGGQVTSLVLTPRETPAGMEAIRGEGATVEELPEEEPTRDEEKVVEEEALDTEPVREEGKGSLTEVLEPEVEEEETYEEAEKEAVEVDLEGLVERETEAEGDTVVEDGLGGEDEFDEGQVKLEESAEGAEEGFGEETAEDAVDKVEESGEAVEGEVSEEDLAEKEEHGQVVEGLEEAEGVPEYLTGEEEKPREEAEVGPQEELTVEDVREGDAEEGGTESEVKAEEESGEDVVEQVAVEGEEEPGEEAEVGPEEEVTEDVTEAEVKAEEESGEDVVEQVAVDGEEEPGEEAEVGPQEEVTEDIAEAEVKAEEESGEDVVEEVAVEGEEEPGEEAEVAPQEEVTEDVTEAEVKAEESEEEVPVGVSTDADVTGEEESGGDAEVELQDVTEDQVEQEVPVDGAAEAEVTGEEETGEGAEVVLQEEVTEDITEDQMKAEDESAAEDVEVAPGGEVRGEDESGEVAEERPETVEQEADEKVEEEASTVQEEVKPRASKGKVCQCPSKPEVVDSGRLCPCHPKKRVSMKTSSVPETPSAVESKPSKGKECVCPSKPEEAPLEGRRSRTCPCPRRPKSVTIKVSEEVRAPEELAQVSTVSSKRSGRVCKCSTKPTETSSGLLSASRSRLCPCPPRSSRISRISDVEESVIKDEDLEAEEPAPVAEEPAAEVPVEEPVAEDVAVEEPVAEEVPVEEPAEELPVEEPVAEEVPVEEPIAEELPVEEPVAEEVPVEEPIAEELPVEEPVAEEVPVEEPVEEAATEVVPVEEPAAEEVPVEEPPAEEVVPVEEIVAQEAPPVAEEKPVVVEEPAVEEKPAVEEPAAAPPPAKRPPSVEVTVEATAPKAEVPPPQDAEDARKCLERIAELEKNIADLTAENKSLKEVSDLKGVRDECDEKLRMLKEEHEKEIKKLNEVNREMMESYKNELQQMKGQQNESASQLQEMHDEMMQDSAKKYEDEIAGLMKQLDMLRKNMQDELDKKDAELEKVKFDLVTAKNTSVGGAGADEEVKKQLGEAEEEAKRLKDELEKCKGRLLEKPGDSDKEDLLREVERLKGELAEAKKEIAKLGKDLEAQEKKARSLENENSQLKVEGDKLKKDSAVLMEENEDLKTSNAKLETVKERISKMTVVSSHSVVSRRDSAEQDKKVKVLQAENSALKDELARLKEELGRCMEDKPQLEVCGCLEHPVKRVIFKILQSGVQSLTKDEMRYLHEEICVCCCGDLFSQDQEVARVKALEEELRQRQDRAIKRVAELERSMREEKLRVARLYDSLQEESKRRESAQGQVRVMTSRHQECVQYLRKLLHEEQAKVRSLELQVQGQKLQKTSKSRMTMTSYSGTATGSFLGRK